MRSLPRHRGFALLIVVVLGVAMVVVAVAMTLSSGSQAIASIHTEGAELARLSAESGLARAEAVAIQTLKNSGSVDFDRVLDPDLTADCTGLDAAAFNLTTTGSTPKAGATTFLPKFTDGTSVDYPSGKKWMRVTLERGAYLVRYEDNADDGITPAGDWSARTGNNAGLSCNEGSAHADNPARDRDGAIWVHAMGIYPGTNPATAVHRVLLRKLVRLPSAANSLAFYVKGNLKDVGANNSRGNAMVKGNVEGGERFCGRLTVGGSSTATADATCSPTPNLFVHEPGVGSLADKTVDVVAANSQWYDWSSSCNFYVNSSSGLFYWDSAATRGSACNAYTGDLVDPVPDPSVIGGCWTPIMRVDGSNVTPYQPFGVDVAAGGACASFQPCSKTLGLPGADCSSTAADTYSDPGSPSAGSPFTSYFTSATTVNIPDFGACSVAGSPSELRWPASPIGASTPALATQPASFTRITCHPDCDGSKDTLKLCAGAGDSALQFADNPASYVVGVVYVDGNLSLNGSGFSSTAPPTSSNGVRTTWPMFTLIVAGNFSMSVNDKFWVGVGTRKSGFPSLVVEGNVDMGDSSGSATLRTLGSFNVKSNVSMKKSLVMFGPVTVGGNLEGLPGSNGVWNYDYDFFGIDSSNSILTYPLSF
jgi:hypothetical protein